MLLRVGEMTGDFRRSYPAQYRKTIAENTTIFAPIPRLCTLPALITDQSAHYIKLLKPTSANASNYTRKLHPCLKSEAAALAQRRAHVITLRNITSA